MSLIRITLRNQTDFLERFQSTRMSKRTASSNSISRSSPVCRVNSNEFSVCFGQENYCRTKMINVVKSMSLIRNTFRKQTDFLQRFQSIRMSKRTTYGKQLDPSLVRRAMFNFHFQPVFAGKLFPKQNNITVVITISLCRM